MAASLRPAQRSVPDTYELGGCASTGPDIPWDGLQIVEAQTTAAGRLGDLLADAEPGDHPAVVPARPLERPEAPTVTNNVAITVTSLEEYGRLQLAAQGLSAGSSTKARAHRGQHMTLVPSPGLPVMGGFVLVDGRPWAQAATETQLSDAAAVLDPDARVRRFWLGRARGYSKTTDVAAMTLAAMATGTSHPAAAAMCRGRRGPGRADGRRRPQVHPAQPGA